MADKEVIAEWKRYLESDDYRHNPECGTLLIAQHFAEWGKEQMKKHAVKALDLGLTREGCPKNSVLSVVCRVENIPENMRKWKNTKGAKIIIFKDKEENEG